MNKVPFTVTDEGFLELPITAEMLARAKAKADEMGPLRNSIRNGGGNFAGFLGEELILTAWAEARSHNTFQHDVTWESVRFEIKAKDRTVPPALDFEASVADFNTKQQADFYGFTSIYRPRGTSNYLRGTICGIISKADYFKKATYLSVGEVDPSNGWVVKAACYNLPYSALSRFEDWRSL